MPSDARAKAPTSPFSCKDRPPIQHAVKFENQRDLELSLGVCVRRSRGLKDRITRRGLQAPARLLIKWAVKAPSAS